MHVQLPQELVLQLPATAFISVYSADCDAAHQQDWFRQQHWSSAAC
jgi:hypothetical protein